MTAQTAHSASNLSQAGTKTPGVRGGWLDGLRFWAAFFVVVYHYASEAPVPIYDFHPAFDRGYLATDFFLMLSGFVLGKAYGRAVEEGKIAPLAFLTKRLARIWPAHIIVLIMTAALVFAAHLAGFDPQHPARFNAGDFWPQALLIQAWGDFGGGGWNLPSWSLSALIICYAAFPLVWPVVRRMGAIAAVCFAALMVLGADALCWANFGRGLYDLPFQYGVLRAAPLFILGAALASLPAMGRRTALVLGLGGLATFFGVQLIGRHDGLSIAAIATVVACLGAMPVIKPSKLAAYGGKISFSLFITHVLAAVVWFGVVHKLDHLPDTIRWILWAGSLPFALIGAAVFERLIDKPVQDFINPRLSALLKRPATTATA